MEASKSASLFLRAIKGREKVLPKPFLERYLRSILGKREFLLESVYRFGTPQYLFDEPSLTSRITQFKEAFSKHIDRHRIFYAMKSNFFTGICRCVVAQGLGLDVSSGLELTSALTMGCKEIIFSGPGKSHEELDLAVKHRQRVTLLVDSFGELQRLSETIKQRPARGGYLKTGFRVHQQGVWSKFGIPLKDLARMLKEARCVEGIKPCGIQFHTSWNLDPTLQITMINEIGSYLHEHIPSDIWPSLKFLDIGGGFWPEQGEWLNPQNTLKGRLIELLNPGAKFRLKHYYREARPLDYFAKEIARAFSKQAPPLRDLEVWMEPGRWISTPAMHILLRVVDKKDARTAITDGGINLLGWERPLTEFIPVVNLTQPSQKEQRARILGSLCTPHDVWGSSYFGGGINAGDILLIPDQGAYTYSLRQSFIKPKARVIRFDGNAFEEAEKEERLTKGF